jgi:hypothetical protein
VPHGILQVFIIILYENVFQNPEVFPTQVSLSPKQSTLVGAGPAGLGGSQWELGAARWGMAGPEEYRVRQQNGKVCLLFESLLLLTNSAC